MAGAAPRGKLSPEDSSLEQIDWSSCEFLDLGAGRGGSIDYSRRRFHAERGIGIDKNPRKVEAARAAGFDVRLGDATALTAHKRVRFVSMMDFLEHLPDLDAVEAMIAAAARVATDFIFIFHPSFEGKEYLAQLGLSLYWWEDRGHTAQTRVSDYCDLFNRLGLRQYMFRNLNPIGDSEHPSVVNAGEILSPEGHDPGARRPRPAARFDRPVWRAQEIFVALRAFQPEEWNKLTRAGWRGESEKSARAPRGGVSCQ